MVLELPDMKKKHKIHTGTLLLRSKGLACHTLRRSRVDFCWVFTPHLFKLLCTLNTSGDFFYLALKAVWSQSLIFSAHLASLLYTYIYIYMHPVSSIKNKKHYTNSSGWHLNMPTLFAYPSLTIPLLACHARIRTFHFQGRTLLSCFIQWPDGSFSTKKLPQRCYFSLDKSLPSWERQSPPGLLHF